MARIGSYLEKDIALLFEKIGFDVSLNSKEFGFESDIIAKKNKFIILVQTKLYEHSYINVKEILHQWESKGRHVQADRVLVVISGFEISPEYFDLAKKLGIYLWDDNILDKLKRIESKELYDKIGRLLHFKEIMKKLEEQRKKDDEFKAEELKKATLKKKKALNIELIIVLITFALFSFIGYITYISPDTVIKISYGIFVGFFIACISFYLTKKIVSYFFTSREKKILGNMVIINKIKIKWY